MSNSFLRAITPSSIAPHQPRLNRRNQICFAPPLTLSRRLSPWNPADLIPLSHFELDHPAPVEGWAAHLGRRGIAFLPDDLGRDSIRRQDARRLLDEQRTDELPRAKLREGRNIEAVEADQQFRARLPRGLPVSAIPEGAAYGDVVRQAALDARPRRRSMFEESLAGQAMTYHCLAPAEDGESWDSHQGSAAAHCPRAGLRPAGMINPK